VRSASETVRLFFTFPSMEKFSVVGIFSFCADEEKTVTIKNMNRIDLIKFN
jgi:hypothetical protein